MNDRPTEVKCEGKCNFTVKWQASTTRYVSDDKSERWYGLYVKDQLQQAVCFGCYEKGVRFKN